MYWIMKPNRVPWCSIRRDKIFAGYGLSKIVYAGKKILKKRKIISTHSNVKGTYRPWVRIWVLLRKFYKKERERRKSIPQWLVKLENVKKHYQLFFLMNGKLLYNSFKDNYVVRLLVGWIGACVSKPPQWHCMS